MLWPCFVCVLYQTLDLQKPGQSRRTEAGLSLHSSGCPLCLRICLSKVRAVTVLGGISSQCRSLSCSSDPWAPQHLWVRFPLPSLPSCLISLTSQVITSGELICCSTWQQQAWHQPKPEKICLTDKMHGSKDRAHLQLPLTFKHCFRDFFPRAFFNMICKYSVPLRGLVLSQKCIAQSGSVLLENAVCTKGITAMPPCSCPPLPWLFHTHRVQPGGNWASACFQAYF